MSESIFDMPGFLGTEARFLTDLTLVVELLFYMVLCIGVIAQLKRLYRWHDRLQTPVVVLNLVFIGLVMGPSFFFVLGQLPDAISFDGVYIPLIHGLLGLVAQGLSVYCLLAGFNILPRHIGILRYWMWAAFISWTVTIFFGLAVYIIWYVPPPAAEQFEVQRVGEHDADVVSEHDGDILEPTAEAQVLEPAFETVWLPITPANAGPGPRYEHSLSYNAATNQVYVFGGHDAEQLYNDVWAFNLDDLTWRQLAGESEVAPAPRYGSIMVVDDAGENLYVTVGQDNDLTNYNDIWRLDLATGTWQNLSPTAGDRPSPRFGGSGGWWNGNILVTHGFGQARYKDSWLFNLQTGQWDNITPEGDIPFQRCMSGASFIGNQMVMHGGCASPEGPCYLDDTWVFDLVGGGGWQQLSFDQRPAGRQDQVLVRMGDSNQMLLYGGIDAELVTRGDVWHLDLDAGVWQPVAQTAGPEPRRNHMAVWVPGVADHPAGMLVFGGQTGSDDGLDDMWLLVRQADIPATAVPAVEPTAAPVQEQPTPTPTIEVISEHDGE